MSQGVRMTFRLNPASDDERRLLEHLEPMPKGLRTREILRLLERGLATTQHMRSGAVPVIAATYPAVEVAPAAPPAQHRGPAVAPSGATMAPTETTSNTKPTIKSEAPKSSSSGQKTTDGGKTGAPSLKQFIS